MESMNKQWSRRAFLGSAAAACVSLAIPAGARNLFTANARRLKLGLITDLHHDIMHDSMQRLEAFLSAMDSAKPDAILQLGDFAYPSPKNKPLIDRFNTAHPTRIHVIGNHDTDSGFTHQQCVDVWGMPAPYYSQVVNGFRFIVLNGNEKGSPKKKGGYPAYIGPAQTAWLQQQITDSREPVIVLSHQPLAGFMGIDNEEEIQQILTTGKDKVLLAINGHTHVDAVHYAGDIPYLTINSASYFWVGDNYKHESYTPEVHRDHPWISRTCPYKDSLFGTLTIDPVKFTITLESRSSKWVGKSPGELGFVEKEAFNPGKEIVPLIRGRKLTAKGRMKKS